MPKRKPTAAERRQWEMDIQKVDIAADRADIIAQMDAESGLREAIDRLKAYRESHNISLRDLEASRVAICLALKTTNAARLWRRSGSMRPHWGKRSGLWFCGCVAQRFRLARTGPVEMSVPEW